MKFSSLKYHNTLLLQRKNRDVGAVCQAEWDRTEPNLFRAKVELFPVQGLYAGPVIGYTVHHGDGRTVSDKCKRLCHPGSALQKPIGTRI